jgi:protease-4
MHPGNSDIPPITPASEPSEAIAQRLDNTHDAAQAASIQTPQTPASAPPSDTLTLPSNSVNQLSTLLATHLKEQRTARRWKYGFRILLVGLFIIAVLWPMMRGSSNTSATAQHVALIKLEGTIEYGSAAGAEPIMAALQAAFEDSASAAALCNRP